MKECYLCGISEEKTFLYEGIHRVKGIVNVCRKCYFRDKIPLLDKKEVNIETINSRESVRDRLSKIAHVSVEKNVVFKEPKKFHQSYENIHLQDLVEKNFKKEVLAGIKSPPDLIDNFHWVIMRKRRSLKISKENLAEAVKEPFISVESLEKGILPRDYRNLVKKVEAHLGIRIFKTRDIGHNDIILESKVPSGILIEDLKKKEQEEKEKYIDARNLSLEKIKDVYGVPKEPEKDEDPRIEKRGIFSFWKKKKKTPEEKKEKPKDELTDEEVSKLVWGK